MKPLKLRNKKGVWIDLDTDSCLYNGVFISCDSMLPGEAYIPDDLLPGLIEYLQARIAELEAEKG